LILYEYPLNERIRTLLRLEDLFTRFDHFADQAGPLEHHVALTTLFEILEVASRADLKSDLLQELERQRQTLLVFRDNPNVSSEALERVFDPFWRAADDGGGPPGHGLGLTIAERICAVAGWSLSVASEPGRGTRARVRLSTPAVIAPT
jgi:signal transduction histidine kinase